MPVATLGSVMTGDADAATEPTVEQPGLDEPDLEQIDGISRDLAQVEEALVRLDEDTYGRCDVCRAEIGDEVLADHPTRSLCEAHLPAVGN